MTISAPTHAGDKPVCAEPENLALVDRASSAKGKYAYKVREQMFEELCAGCPCREGGAEFTKARAKRYDSAEVRAWAREAGLAVPVRGLPKREVFDAYAAAHAVGMTAGLVGAA